MRIEHIIDEQTKRKLNYSEKPKRSSENRKKQSNGKNVKYIKQNHRKNEKLSERDIKELMGINRDIYKRVNGKVKRK